MPLDAGRPERQEELRSFSSASAGIHSFVKRRTATRLWCGVLFCTLAIACSPPVPHNEQPRRNDLVLGVPESTAAGADRGVRQPVAGLTLEGLTALNVDGRAVPRLAESWAWENGGRTLRLRIRQDVVFHDGTPFTASTATDALREAIARPNNRALYSSLTDIASVAADGTRDVVIRLSQPSAFLPEDLELPLIRGNQIGTGPFKVVQNQQAEIVLDRFNSYYLGTPKIDRVTVRAFSTLRTAWASLLRGDIDMVTNVPPEAVEFVTNDRVRVLSFSRHYQYLIAFNSN